MALDMILRELPIEEWKRLEGWQLNTVLPFASPEFTRVLVVEDEDGAIIGAQALLSMIHWEGLQIAPDHQGKGAVLRALLEVLTDGTVAAEGVMTAAADPELEAQIRRLGAIELGAKSFYLPLLSVRSHRPEGS